MKRTKWIILLFFAAAGHSVQAQNYTVERSSVTYKAPDKGTLEMYIYTPQMPVEVELPAIVFYFGGGWVSGTPDHFRLQAEYLASRGMIAICPDYRTKNSHGTTPFESVKDARSAMRYLKIHGPDMGIDTSRIVAAGGSAGGHLAACTAIIDGINEESDDLTISPVPYAMVLFNPVVDTGKLGYGQKKLNGREFEISPVHHITPGIPPTLILHGKADTTVPYENAKRFRDMMKQAGNKCILKGYNHQKHGFFNYSRSPRNFKKTLRRSELFLEDLGLLRGETWLKKYMKKLEKSGD